MFADQWVDHKFQVAGQKFIQPVQREVDAMVGDAALGEVIGADPLGAIAAADQIAAVFGLFGALFFMRAA